MELSRRELATSLELTELLRGLFDRSWFTVLFRGHPKESCSYRGIAFDIYHRGYYWSRGGDQGPSQYVQDVQARIGNYAKVWLPTPLNVDMFLRLRDEQVSDEDGLDVYFEINAGYSHLARRCLEGPLSAVLLRLGQAYLVVEMRDDFVEFGPLDRRPVKKEIAADFDALIDALITLCSDSDKDDLVEPDLGEDAPFCFHCGFTVHPGTPVCPRCQGPLDDDPDEDEDVV